MFSKYHKVTPSKWPVNVAVDRCPVARDKAEKRICVFRVGAAGDIVMTTPLLAALRKAYPTAYITWVVEHKHAQAIAANPHVDEIFIWHGGHWSKCIRRKYPPFSWDLGWLKRLVASWNLDIFISFHGEQFGWLTENCGAATKIGFFDEDFVTEHSKVAPEALARFRHVVYKQDLTLHRSDLTLCALDGLGISKDIDRQMYFGYTETDKKAAADILAKRGLREAGKYVTVAPYTTWISRNWPADRFAAVCDRLVEKFSVDIVLLGSAKQVDDLKAVTSAMRHKAIALAGDLSLAEMGAAIHDGRFLLTCDTGPMHIAAGVDAPFVAVFGSTPASKLAPIKGRGTVVQKAVPCGPCYLPACPNPPESYKKCLDIVTVDDVYAACAKILSPEEIAVG
jgi:ADP-heptose:LPS heptosyltransferase